LSVLKITTKMEYEVIYIKVCPVMIKVEHFLDESDETVLFKI
jgi:hypothetical protein